MGINNRLKGLGKHKKQFTKLKNFPFGKGTKGHLQSVRRIEFAHSKEIKITESGSFVFYFPLTFSA